jgi:aspartate aminotransferase
MHLSDRINRIEPSATLAAAAEAEKLRQQGVDVVDFGPGEPDFPTPEHVKQAAIRAIEQNHSKYTAVGGILPLRQAIVEWHAAQLGSQYEPAECVASTGGKHALFNAMSVLLGAGDEVLVPVPYWVTFPDIVRYAGATPVFIPTHAAEGFQLRAAAVEQALTPRTRMLVVNSPNNPSGAVVPPEEFARIYEVCCARGIWLLTDECYSHFTYGAARPFSVASLPGAKPHVIVAGSLSKTFAMTGWRMGYTLGPRELVDAIAKLQSQSTSNPTSITQHAAVAAMRGPMEPCAAMLAEYARRREHILAGLRAIPGLTCTAPDGAFYIFPHVQALQGPATGGDTCEMARHLLHKAHVAVVPGDAFGMPGYLRFSYATSMERIEEGLRRVTRFFTGQAVPATP